MNNFLEHWVVSLFVFVIVVAPFLFPFFIANFGDSFASLEPSDDFVILGCFPLFS